MHLETRSDAAILAVADAIMDILMEASTAMDHACHVKDFTNRLKAIVTKEYFERVCRQYQVGAWCNATSFGLNDLGALLTVVREAKE